MSPIPIQRAEFGNLLDLSDRHHRDRLAVGVGQPVNEIVILSFDEICYELRSCILIATLFAFVVEAPSEMPQVFEVFTPRQASDDIHDLAIQEIESEQSVKDTIEQ